MANDLRNATRRSNVHRPPPVTPQLIDNHASAISRPHFHIRATAASRLFPKPAPPRFSVRHRFRKPSSAISHSRSGSGHREHPIFHAENTERAPPAPTRPSNWFLRGSQRDWPRCRDAAPRLAEGVVNDHVMSEPAVTDCKREKGEPNVSGSSVGEEMVFTEKSTFCVISPNPSWTTFASKGFEIE